ncbi:MAG TPA: twin-arginine translocase TatA/TatE family subunit [Mucilaginibacter sp.]|nr:twin-arginine translocase TatA/TatE family subunit [Mucilaginibacter sp.]
MHSLVLGFLNIGSSEMILIVFVALLLFGGEKLPEIARGLGKGIRDFKDASEGVKREINNQINSFEEKREEDKRVEEAIKARQESEKELPAHGFTPVENTMPVNDNYSVPVDEHETATDVVEEHNKDVTAEHPAENHETVTSGQNKNT